MKSRIQNQEVEVNAGSMADIAFLLLIFFLVATTLATQKGLGLLLPPDTNEQPPIKFNERNIFKILVNSENRILVEDKEFISFPDLKFRAKQFIMNYGKNPELSDSPEKAVFSIKTSRKTRYKVFISILDVIKGAYYEIYANQAGITEHQFRNLRFGIAEERELYEKGKRGIPMNISIAEPN